MMCIRLLVVWGSIFSLVACRVSDDTDTVQELFGDYEEWSCDAPFITNGPGPYNMVLVEQGSYSYWEQGSGEYILDDSLPDFFIDKYPVTAKDYERCVSSGKCEVPSTMRETSSEWLLQYLDDADPSTLRTYGNHLKRHHPVNFVNYNQASEYCESLGKRLPTAKEWEKAARGPKRSLETTWDPNDVLETTWDPNDDAEDSETAVPIPLWMGQSPTRTNHFLSADNHEDSNGFGTTPVGYYDGRNTVRFVDPESAGLVCDGGFYNWLNPDVIVDTIDSKSYYGVYDMLGNVWEWTSSKSPVGYSDREDAVRFVAKGGSFATQLANISCRSDYDCQSLERIESRSDLGFRCVKDDLSPIPW